MSPGMRITATTSVGTIAITAVDELTRSYTWDGATRAVEMSPRATRWFGSLGLFNPGAGEHWRDHHGITRCVTKEGQQHFKTVEEAMKWIKERELDALRLPRRRADGRVGQEPPQEAVGRRGLADSHRREETETTARQPG